MAEQPKIQGWKDVQLTPDMPLSVLVNFLNVLNQRLVALEDSVTIPYNNKMVTLTELYAIQAELEKAEMEKRAAEAKNQEQPADESKGA